MYSHCLIMISSNKIYMENHLWEILIKSADVSPPSTTLAEARSPAPPAPQVVKAALKGDSAFRTLTSDFEANNRGRLPWRSVAVAVAVGSHDPWGPVAGDAAQWLEVYQLMLGWRLGPQLRMVDCCFCCWLLVTELFKRLISWILMKQLV